VTAGGAGGKKAYTVQARTGPEQFEKVLRFTTQNEADVRAGAELCDVEDAEPRVRGSATCAIRGCGAAAFQWATAQERRLHSGWWKSCAGLITRPREPAAKP